MLFISSFVVVYKGLHSLSTYPILRWYGTPYNIFKDDRIRLRSLVIYEVYTLIHVI